MSPLEWLRFARWRWGFASVLKGRNAPFSIGNLNQGALFSDFKAGASPVAAALSAIAYDQAARAQRRAASIDTGIGECRRCGSHYMRVDTRHERRGLGVMGAGLFLVCAVGCLIPGVGCLSAVVMAILIGADQRTVPVQYRVCNECGFWAR